MGRTRTFLNEVVRKLGTRAAYDYGKVTDRLSKDPTIHALARLEQLFPLKEYIVSGMYEDYIGINFVDKDFDDRLTEEDMLELYRCGLRYHDEHGYVIAA